MKKKIVIIGLMVIIVFAIIIFNISKSGLSKIKLSAFINEYNILIQENINQNIKIGVPKESDKDGATYWVKLNNELDLGLTTDSNSGTLDLNKNNISISSIRYPKNIFNYTEIDKYLYYLIKVNNNKLKDKDITEIINKLRKNINKEVAVENLFISHTNDLYQIDSIGRYEK
ncbi:MAG: hypothetical protein RSB45_01240 [Bacilli bacterium]